MREIIDITLTISPSLPVWPGDPKVSLERFNKMEEGAIANISKMNLGVHTGTHVDAPYHFIPGGDTVDHLNLDILVGNVQVVFVDVSGDTIEVDDLRKAGIKSDTTRLIIKTRNSEYWDHIENGFQEGFAALSPEASRYLVDKGIKLVGIDYLSIAPFNRGQATHEVLLKSQMIVVEGLDLRKVQPGNYSLVCLPLKLKDTDGSPARVILINE